MDLGAPEIMVIVIAVLLLFGYKKLPDASRSIGRSLRIFRGEMTGMPDTASAPGATVTGEVLPVHPPASPGTVRGLEEEARVAEARAAELRARIVTAYPDRTAH